jgi:class 3 adenylate cyclase
MSQPVKFEFDRSRGIIWVCDVSGSSARLNSDDGVEDTEQFLPRLYWIASRVVESSGGRFIKWTGDGFLAWFETALHREMEGTVARCLEAVWHLTIMVNVTQLGLSPKRKFKLRHGITYEQDALLTKITHPGGFESLDLLGRAVVLAFRLSGVETSFPCVAASREIVEAGREVNYFGFRRWRPTADERLKIFKAERWGVNTLYTSGAKSPARRGKHATLKNVNAVIKNAEGHLSVDNPRLKFSRSLLSSLAGGPDWSRKMASEYLHFLRESLLGTLKSFAKELVNTGSNERRIE